MHLFHDSTLNTWKLITEKLPKSPPLYFTYYVINGKSYETGQGAWEAYDSAIAALKQNALTVGNPKAIEILYHGCPISDDQGFIKWYGGYKTKEFIRIKDVDLPWTEVVKPKNYQPGEAWESKTVAILTLPEEKTLENMTKEQAAEAFADSRDRRGTSYWKGLYDGYLEASGSVAAPKEEQDLKVLQDRFKNDYANEIFKQENRSLRQQLKEREESIKELWPLAQRSLIWGGSDDIRLKEIRDAISRAKALLDKE